MDQESIEGAMVDARYEYGSNRRRSIRGKLIERWILQEMDEGTIEGVMDGCKRWIRGQWKERKMLQAMDQEAIEGAIDATSDGSGNN